jgi:hypothetical protein
VERQLELCDQPLGESKIAAEIDREPALVHGVPGRSHPVVRRLRAAVT